jgi:hypothetical protein
VGCVQAQENASERGGRRKVQNLEAVHLGIQ